MPIFNNILAGSSGQATGYEIEQSLRFDDGDSAYLNRTPGSASNQKTWTWSCWVKRGNMGAFHPFFEAYSAGANKCYIAFDSNDNLKIQNTTSSSDNLDLRTSAKYRDPSAWYHIVVAVDTTQTTSSNRAKVYVNGEQVTDFGTETYPAEDADLNINSTYEHKVGEYTGDGAHYDGYLAELHFIDGQALTPASFGETNSATNQWVPIEYTGSYGTNGFYQKYSTPYGIEAFTTTGSHTWTCPAGVTSVEVLVVGGGGGGGNHYYGGGGGAGGVVHDATYAVTPGTVYDLSVGAGGASQTNGTNSVFNINGEGTNTTVLTANGGGRGGEGAGGGAQQTGSAGGSGGGGAGYGSPNAGGSSNQTSPTGATGYGNAGGTSSGDPGAGGGGAGAAGSDGSSGSGGAGGAGRLFSTFTGYGASGYFGGGGGGAAHPTSGAVGGAGGQGGGGAGGKDGTNPVAGTANTGGGGGGTTYHDIPSGAAGGSGVVLISIDAGLGADSSGNGNNFSATNLVATDVVGDSPTNNFCTLNPLNLVTNTTISEGNLKADCTSSNDGAALGTMAVSSGKWYWEVLQTTANANNDISMGVMELSRKMAPQGVGADVYPNAYLYGNDGWNAKYNSTTSTINTYGAGDIIGWALDLDGNTLKIYKNNSLEYTYSSGVSGTFTPLAAVDGTSGQSVTHIANFGQDSSFNGEKTAQGNGGDGEDFYYTPPTGFKALNTSNLSDPSIADPTKHFNTKLYTGTGSELAVTGVGFQPDFTWIKTRALTYNHRVFDVVRGVTKELYTNTTGAEVTDDAQTLKSFDSDGFTLGTSSGVNPSSTMASWNWKAGGTASSNTDGSITSSVSANPTAGFSIVNWNGTEASATIGHGLSQAPELIIVKDVDTAGRNWPTNIENITGTANQYLFLNATDSAATSSAYWGGTPGASVFTVGDSANTNDDASMIAYCFHSVEGYSKLGSYTGNGNADGSFVYTGFRPAFVMIKRYDSTSGANWILLDSKRDTFNIAEDSIYANLSNAEEDVGRLDFVSNGFKLRQNGTTVNTSSGTYIYLAFAESPFKYSNAR